MPKIFQVIQNVKHNGAYHSVGAFLEAEIGALEHLVLDGVLRVIEGASSIPEAEAIVAKEKAEAGEQATAEQAKEPENTWEPKKDEVDTEEKPPVETAPINTEVDKPSEVDSTNTRPENEQGDLDEETGANL